MSRPLAAAARRSFRCRLVVLPRRFDPMKHPGDKRNEGPQGTSGLQMPHAYDDRSETQRKILDGVMERVFRGSPGNLVLQALASKPASSEERQRIRELLDRLEREED